MKITLVGSLSREENIKKMREIKEKLSKEHEVRMPFFTDFFGVKAFKLAKNKKERREIKRAAIILHLKEVEWADAILIVNPDGYVGPNTFLEIMYAFYLGKDIYAIKPIKNKVFEEELEPVKIKIVGEELKF